MKYFAVFFFVFAVALAVVHGLQGAEAGYSQLNAAKSLARDESQAQRSGLSNFEAQRSGQRRASHEDSHEHSDSHEKSHERHHNHKDNAARNLLKSKNAE